jgi:hypothetical protein
VAAAQGQAHGVVAEAAGPLGDLVVDRADEIPGASDCASVPTIFERRWIPYVSLSLRASISPSVKAKTRSPAASPSALSP